MKRFRKTIRKPGTLRKKGPQIHYDKSLDLHGCTVQEAISLLDNEILYSQIQSLLVIHGKGTGTLKREIRHYLSSHKDVSRIEYGEVINLPGQDGVTLVRLT